MAKITPVKTSYDMLTPDTLYNIETNENVTDFNYLLEQVKLKRWNGLQNNIIDSISQRPGEGLSERISFVKFVYRTLDALWIKSPEMIRITGRGYMANLLDSNNFTHREKHYIRLFALVLISI